MMQKYRDCKPVLSHWYPHAPSWPLPFYHRSRGDKKSARQRGAAQRCDPPEVSTNTDKSYCSQSAKRIDNAMAAIDVDVSMMVDLPVNIRACIG